MPELPEVETVMRGLAPVMEGQVIASVYCGEKGLRFPFPDRLAGRIQHAKIKKLERRAKYILIYLSENNILVIHLGMSGRIRILAPGSNAPPEKHDHFELGLADGHRIILNDARRFGMVFDVAETDFLVHKSFCHLGPEPLLDDFNAGYLREKLKNKSSAIKVAIMDQRLVVGVGNIYACEALYRAGISPIMSAQKVSKAKLEEFVKQIKIVLMQAIAAGGSTLRDHRLPDGDFGYFQQTLNVYGRAGQDCMTWGCEQTIHRIVQAGRSTFYCPHCQK